MKTKAVRLHGKNDLRLSEFELPRPGDDQILARVVTDSICMSTYKAMIQGEDHKRVPGDIGDNPVIVGHETSGIILEAGRKWSGRYRAGDRFGLQPAIDYPGLMGGAGAPGYSYPFMGGAATHIVIPNEIMERDCLLPYEGEAFYLASLAEPVSTIIGTFHAMYHTEKYVYRHAMGIVEGGCTAILAGAGPMGMGAVDYAVHGPRRPRLLVVTDIDDERLRRSSNLLSVNEAAAHGVELHYVNTRGHSNPAAHIRGFTNGKGFDDAIVFAPIPALFEQADGILGHDGCLNIFAGPTDPALSALVNLYDIHYSSHHIMGTSGGGKEDMIEALELIAAGRINPSAMITHIGGLNAAAETTAKLPWIPGGRKLIYTNISLELTAIDDFREKGKTDPLFHRLADITDEHHGLWCPEAERFLLENGPAI